MITMYEYVASHNPGMAMAILKKHGYVPNQSVSTAKDLGVCLAELAATEGETALKDIADNHPDKELILELYGSGMTPIKSADSWYKNADGGHGFMPHPCGCCQKPRYMSYDGTQDTSVATPKDSINSASITSMTIIGAIAIIVLASNLK